LAPGFVEHNPPQQFLPQFLQLGRAGRRFQCFQGHGDSFGLRLMPKLTAVILSAAKNLVRSVRDASLRSA
jgi:hypothetical protein